jgi:serine/threonine-protein kinase
LAFVAVGASGRQLFVRPIDQLQATALAGTEGVTSPFFSPDGQSIAFFASGKLKKIAVTGGAAVAICATDQGRGGWWADDDTIVVQPIQQSSPLMRVPAAGGTPTPIGKLAQGEVIGRWPQMLPGGKAVLYTSHSALTGFDSANIVVLPLDGGAPKVAVRGGFHGRYAASGHLLYIHEGTLFAVPFDLARLEPAGRAVPVVEGVVSSSTNGGAQFSFSETGTLVFSGGQGSSANRPIFWMDRTGATTPLRTAGTDWINPRFSPDGQRLALAINDGAQFDVWMYDWKRDTPTKLSFDPGLDFQPFWTPDGKRIVFSSDRAVRGINNIYWLRADGGGDVQRLTESPVNQTAWSIHPSGRWIAFAETRSGTAGDLMILPMEGDEASGWKPGKPSVFLSTPANEVVPMFSPDGRWIAYMSNESGGMQVYVRPFPGPGGKWQISSGSVAAFPTWSRTHPELLFVEVPSSKIMVSSYRVAGDSFQADKARPWSTGSLQLPAMTSVFDLHPDGERVAMAKPPDSAAGRRDKVVFIFNFFETLRRVAPQQR